MSAHLVIAGITDNEPVDSVTVDGDGKTFHVVINAGEIGTTLWQYANDGRSLDLVGIVTSNGTWELKNVYVTGVQVGTGDPPQMTVTFAAEEVSQA